MASTEDVLLQHSSSGDSKLQNNHASTFMKPTRYHECTDKEQMQEVNEQANKDLKGQDKEELLQSWQYQVTGHLGAAAVLKEFDVQHITCGGLMANEDFGRHIIR